jgi:hypothetical protein
VRGVLRPAPHADVDLGDGAVAVAQEERGKAALQRGRQHTIPVASGQFPGRAAAQRGGGRRVAAQLAGKRPQPQVHLGGAVVGQRPQHVVHRVGVQVRARDLARQPEHGEAGAGRRHRQGQHREGLAEHLHRALEPLVGGELRGCGRERAHPVADPLDAPTRGIGPQQRQRHQHRHPEADQRAQEPADERRP